MVELGATRPGGVRDALAEAVGDPSLELLLWEPSHRRWITPAGAVAELPDDSARAVTLIGDHLAAVVHDPVLADQARVIVRAGSAAWLALENERLQAELRRQLEELRASRARIVAVGDEERRRLERDLHDGAQQRLLGVGLALQLLRPRLSAPADAEPVLAEAEDELRAALEELRELARGIHPAILTEQGLEPALRSLASRSPVHVSVETSDCGALPGEVESTVYFVAAEALTNVVKHAGASQVWLSLGRRNGAVRLVVRDDGRGGADAAGSGLVGLVDRVGALGGSLTVALGRGRRHPAGSRDPVRVVVADDSAIVREGIARVLTDNGIEVCGTAGDAAGALQSAESESPDVVILDIRMPPTFTDEGLRAAETIARAHPQIGVLVLSQHLETEYALRLVDGARERCGYLLKDRVTDIGHAAGRDRAGGRRRDGHRPRARA